jgi:hypothetical protein
MNKIELFDLKMDELDSDELVQTKGGISIALSCLGGYFLYQIAANPQASWDAFMRGWNSF